MARLRLQRHAVAFAALPAVVDPGPLARIAEVGAAGHPGLLTRAKAAHASGSDYLDRAAAAALIGELNPALPPPPPAARYIVAGQQAGLLTGPLYTFLKAATAIRLARDLDTPEAPVLPLFWIASEDHDVLEVNRVTVNGRRFVHEYAGPLARGAVPQVADIDLSAAREPLLAFLRETLPPTEFTEGVLEIVAAADFHDYATAFRDILRALFARWPLRVVDPIALRPRTAPVLARLVERWDEIPAGLAEGAAQLARTGLAAPLTGARLFEIVAGKRVPREVVAGGRAALAEEIRAHPARFSGSAALRPICQDAVLPVLATLGGPTELAYLWQIQPLYALAGVRPSLRHPRVSATFLSPGPARALDQLDVPPDKIFDVHEWLARPAKDTSAEPPAIAGMRAKAQDLLAELDRYRPVPEPRWYRRSHESIAAAMERIAAGLMEERRAAEGRDRARIERLAAAVLPEGRLQERVVNVLQFVDLHGPAFVGEAIEALDPWDYRHQVVTIAEGKDPHDAG